MQISRIIEPRMHDLGGGFIVRRVLPFHAHRSVGPFVFFDHFGPVEFDPGASFNVLPHPHIGLSTVTFLFDGAIRHRDSLGTDLVIEPGAVNCDEEDCAPAFIHPPADTLPAFRVGDVRVKVLAGSAWKHTSPVSFPWPILYVALETDSDADIILPAEMAIERALYVVTGSAQIGASIVTEGRMAVLGSDTDVTVKLAAGTKAMICGGAPMESPRKMDWNFVSSDTAKIEQAKVDWTAAMEAGGSERFPLVPGDEEEWIPIPS